MWTHPPKTGLSRRQMIAGSAAALGLSSPLSRLLAAARAPQSAPGPAATVPANKRFKVAGDDTFLLLRQDTKAFTRAKECGLDGIALDMGSMSGGKTFTNVLRDEGKRQEFLEMSRSTGVEICSMQFAALYAWVFPALPFALDATREWVDTMVKMNVKIGHMPIMAPDFVLGKIKEPAPPANSANDTDKAKFEKAQASYKAAIEAQAERYNKTVEIYRAVAPLAEKAGVIMGVESNVDADGYIRFLDAVGSPAVKVVYNPGVGLENKFDVYADIEKLGKDRVCMLHLEQGSVAPETWEHRLGEGPIDFRKLRAVLLKIQWAGWMTIARSRLKGTTSPVTNMTANGKYLHEMFPE